MIYLIYFIILFVIEIGYFKIAGIYNIVDRPNHRSSHNKVTIRGGGIIFTIGFLLQFFHLGYIYSYFIVGLLLITFISFLDDIKPASKKIRILFHLSSVALLFYQLKLYDISYYWVFLAFIVVIGAINAVNFMDGINGITGGYALITLSTLYCINKYVITYTEETYLVTGIIALLVFNFFNFRPKAKCFAGDVGSVSIAFIISFFLLQLILKTNNLCYLLLLLIYGLDIVTTIGFRILRKENILEAHRSHFYQFLANEYKVPHLLVTGLYMLLQGIVNLIVIRFLNGYTITLVISVILTTIIFVFIRLIFEGKKRLLNVKT